MTQVIEYTGKPAMIQVIDKQTHRIYRETCYDTSYRETNSQNIQGNLLL